MTKNRNGVSGSGGFPEFAAAYESLEVDVSDAGDAESFVPRESAAANEED